jgi:hypothetical protein
MMPLSIITRAAFDGLVGDEFKVIGLATDDRAERASARQRLDFISGKTDHRRDFIDGPSTLKKFAGNGAVCLGQTFCPAFLQSSLQPLYPAFLQPLVHGSAFAAFNIHTQHFA